MTIQPGDEVTVRAVVGRRTTGKVCEIVIDTPMDSAGNPATDPSTALPYNHIAFYVRPSQIATHTPKPRELKVGDRVRHKGASILVGVIRAIDGEQAWVLTPEGSHRYTYRLAELELDQ